MHVFPERIITRARRTSSKYNIYWDAEIPMEYYEQGFLEFEEYLDVTGGNIKSTPENPHAKSQYAMKRFRGYERFLKKQSKKEWRQYFKRLGREKCHDDKFGVETEMSNIKERGDQLEMDIIPNKVHEM